MSTLVAQPDTGVIRALVPYFIPDEDSYTGEINGSLTAYNSQVKTPLQRVGIPVREWNHEEGYFIMRTHKVLDGEESPICKGSSDEPASPISITLSSTSSSKKAQRKDVKKVKKIKGITEPILSPTSAYAGLSYDGASPDPRDLPLPSFLTGLHSTVTRPQRVERILFPMA